MNTSCPPLSELTSVFGSLDGSTSTNKKPLCENIFDVQRSELFNVLDRLRATFWNDQAPEIPTAPCTPAPSTPIASIPPSPKPSLKRLRSESAEPPAQKEDSPQTMIKRETAKRARTEKIQQLQPKKTLKSLWKLKLLLIRQLRGDNQQCTSLLTLLKDIEHSKTLEQRRQLGFYLMPVAKAMRRETVIATLAKWCA